MNSTKEKNKDINIIFESEIMKRIVQLANELKNIDSTVLITGESGVGNVRELENTIERLVVTNPSEVIEKDNNKSNIFNSSIYNNYVTTSSLAENIIPLNEAKKEIEKKLIKIAYQKYKSSYKVAEILKISQATAYRKIREYVDDELTL